MTRTERPEQEGSIHVAFSPTPHLRQGWNMLSPEMGEYIDAVMPQQTGERGWYQGTADAVYQNLDFIATMSPANVLVLGGDHLYNSTVVIWSAHSGSYEDHALLLGKDLRKDLVNRGTLG